MEAFSSVELLLVNSTKQSHHIPKEKIPMSDVIPIMKKFISDLNLSNPEKKTRG